MFNSINVIIFTTISCDIASIEYIVHKQKNVNINNVTIITKEYSDLLNDNIQTINNSETQVHYFTLDRSFFWENRLLSFMDRDILVIKDVLFYDININNFIKFFNDKASNISIAAYYDTSCNNYNVLEFDENYMLTSLKDIKKHEDSVFRDTGLYLISNKFFLEIVEQDGFEIFYENFILKLNTNIAISVFPTYGCFVDLYNYRYSNEKKEKAVFLDRDGTINIDNGYVYQYEKFKFIEGTIDSLKSMKEKGYKLIVVTNQSGVARGYYNTEDVEILHHKVNDYLRENYDFEIDEYYYCPHHPEYGDENFMKQCKCRKPMPGMILNAAKDFNIDLEKSFMIGDKRSDEVLLPELKFILIDKDSSLSSIIHRF